MPRPKLNPTPDQRNQVKSFAAFGIAHEDIAKVIGIKSPKTLRKHFRQELDLGAIEANGRVGPDALQDGNIWKLSIGDDLFSEEQSALDGTT
jgi:hypothetical protein